MIFCGLSLLNYVQNGDEEDTSRKL